MTSSNQNVFFSQKRTASNGHLVRSASEYILEDHNDLQFFLRLFLAEKLVYGKNYTSAVFGSFI